MNCTCPQCRRRVAFQRAVNLVGSILFSLIVGALCYGVIVLLFLLPD